MPHEYTIEDAENILYLKSTGTAALDEIGELMHRIAADPRVSRTTRVLVDARELDLDLPTPDLERIAEWHASELGESRISAVVIRPGLVAPSSPSSAPIRSPYFLKKRLPVPTM